MEKSIVERLINLREYVLYMEKRLKRFKVVGITPRIAFYSVELSKIASLLPFTTMKSLA